MGVLKAKVAGNWVPLEYSGGPNPQNALGVVAVGVMMTGQVSIPLAGTRYNVTQQLTFTPLVGRRYRIRCVCRAIQLGGGGTDGWVLEVAVDASGAQGEYYVTSTINYSGIGVDGWFDGDGISHIYQGQIRAIGKTGAVVFTDSPGSVKSSYFYIEDIGPNAAPALPLPATPQAWTPLPFAANWNDLGAIYSCQYRKIGDVVSLRGLATRRNAIANDISQIAQLPAGFYPPGRYSYWTVNRGDVNTAGQIEIRNTGAIMFNGTAPFTALQIGGWVSLETITFSVTP